MTKINNTTNKLKTLNEIGIALSVEKDINKLLEMILTKSREFTNCDAGTFYRLDKKKEKLVFTVMHNDTMKEYSGGTSGQKPSPPAVPLYDENSNPNLSAVSAYVFHTSKSVNIPDIYEVIGSTVILMSGLFIIYRDHKTNSSIYISNI